MDNVLRSLRIFLQPIFPNIGTASGQQAIHGPAERREQANSRRAECTSEVTYNAHAILCEPGSSRGSEAAGRATLSFAWDRQQSVEHGIRRPLQTV